MSLGDAFPYEERVASCRRQLQAGCIIYLYCHFTTPPKDKYLLVASTNPRPLCLVINSEIRDFILRRPHLHSCQVPLQKADYNFFDHDSYVDCLDAITDFNHDDIEKQLVADMRRIKGIINFVTRADIVKAVTAAQTIPLREKTWILNEMQQSVG